MKTPSPAKLKPLIVIVGPTAVGKTALSIQLAKQLDGEIVSADSRLFYRKMDIGTAKPSPEERALVPHHMIDVADPDDVWSLARFQRRAYQTIDGIHARGRLPFLVGGTGQYVWAVVEGWVIPEVKPDSRLRTALENWVDEIGSQGLYNRLMALDPEAAARIDPQNTRRTIRALEVILHSGNLFSAQRRKRGSMYPTLILGLNRPRSELYQRIDARIMAMFDAGFVDEVRSLLEEGYTSDLPPLSAIGYRQVIAYLQNDMTLEEAIIEMKRKTRQFVRRQANWFHQDDPSIHWLQVDDTVVDRAAKIVQEFLGDISTREE